MRRYEGRVTAVTGGSHGIGEATARRLAAEGARVAILDIADASEAAGRLRDAGLTAHGYEADVASERSVAAAAARIAEELGPVDVLVNNAGVLLPGTALSVSMDDWRRTFAVNVDAILLTARAFLPGMVERSAGAIVNVASTGGLFGVPDLAAYNASKGAVVNLTRNLSTDFRRAGVRVNCVCPGWVPTGFNDPLLTAVSDAEVAELVERTVPAGRQADPSEVAAAIAFLGSDDASYVSGHALVVDGGMAAAL